MRLRRWISIILCLAMLCIPVKAQQSPKYVVLTFDDGPSGKFTRQLLEGLAQRQVKATFLLCGYRVKEDPRLTQQILDGGHEIGIHGYTHKTMEDMSQSQVAQELEQTAQVLPAGCKSVFFRPPGGKVTPQVKAASREAGLAILNWSVDPRDWASHDRQTVVQAVVRDAQDGDVILLHDMSETSVAAALAIVDALTQRGFQFVTASELARLRGEKLRPGLVYTRFR